MKSTIKLYFFLSGLILLQACVTNFGRNVPTDLYHSVQSREDVATISNIYGCRDYIELANINQIPPPYLVYPGQTLRIPTDICGIGQAYTTTQPSSTDYYITKRGDTLYSISKTYNVSLTNLTTWNNLEPPFTLLVGQQIRITPPAGNKFQTVDYVPPAPRLLKSRSHLVAKGENLYRISKKYGYSVATIAQWNGISKPYILSIGQRLIVSPPNSISYNNGYSTGTSSYNPGYNPNYASYHIVRAGETLQNIARRYGLTTEKLSAWNGLGAPYYIYPDQRLRLAPP
ncbi:MAG TPA: LysM peptidoglycan-binding domain-containing protein [Thioploca sp.]|nr:LysM peptidoglycan-binding domain-containing protein [Thioploca sp.]